MHFFLTHGTLSLLFLASFLPFSVDCKTVAFSPSIPGQPLIFHHTSHPISTFEKRVSYKLTCDNSSNFSKLSKASKQMFKGLLGIVDTTFSEQDLFQRQLLVAKYHDDIQASIDKVHKIIHSLKSHSAKKLANLLEQTLLSFVKITNEIVVNSVESSSNEFFHLAYLQMQEQVINGFNTGISQIFKKNTFRTSIKAESDSALHGLVSNTNLYISDLKNLSNSGGASSRSVELSREQILKNLTVFIETTFILALPK